MAEFSTKWIKVSEPTPHVLLVELNRTPVNAFSEEYWRMYGEAFDRIAREAHDVRAVVLSSAIPKLFTAGLDITNTGELTTSKGDPSRISLFLQDHIREFQDCIGAPLRCPFPVISAMHGLVLGLGVDIAGACDIRLCASSTSFAIKEVDIGLAADIGSLAYLPKITGNESMLREYAYTGKDFGSAEAEKMGLVSRVVSGGKDEVVKAALTLASEIASKSPIAVMGTKKLLHHSRDHTIQENKDYTATWNGSMLQTLDIPEAVKARLQRKQNVTPQFTPLKPSKSKL